MMNYGAEVPERPQADFAATMPIGQPPVEPSPATTFDPTATPGGSPDDEQEATLLEKRSGSTTKPPPPFPEFGNLGGDDEEMTRMEQVPPEVLAELMARAQASEERAAITPQAPRPTFDAEAPTSAGAPRAAIDDEPTRMGYEVAELAARFGAATNATQLGVPAITPKQPAAAPAPQLDRRNMATQLGVPQQTGAIPGPPRPLSSVPPPPEPPPELPAAEHRRALGGTLFGLQSPAQAALASAPPPAAPPPVHAAPPAPGPSIAPILSVPAQPLQPGQPAPRRVPNAAPTLLGGVIASALAEGNANAAAPIQPAAPGTAGAPWSPPQGHPLHRPADPRPAGASPSNAPAHFAQPTQAPTFAAPAPKKKSGVPLVLVLLLLGGIIAGGGFFALRWHQGRTSSSVTASIDASGSDLELTCPTCADGTKISLGAVFAGKRARVILPTPLEVGDQTLDAVVQAPNESPKSLKIPVAVEFRLDVDTSTLHVYPPVLTLRPRVRPGGALSVAGKPASDVISIPVGEGATGLRDTVAKIPIDVPYKYERAGIPPREGSLHEELNVLPLRLFSPKDGTFSADATVSFQGQAPPGIDVHVGDATLRPDDKGIFQVTRPLTVGDNEIPLWLSRNETGRGGVSRGLTVHVVRSASAASLWTEAKSKLDASKPGDLNALYTDPAGAVGSAFAFAGAVVEAQTQRGETIALIDGSASAANLKPSDPLACKATSCLLRVVSSSTARFAKGQRVRGIGRSVTPRDPKTPEVEAQVLLPLQETK